MGQLRWAVVFAALATGSSAAPARPYYGAGPLQQQELEKLTDEELVKKIASYTKFFKLTAIKRVGTDVLAWSSTDAATDALPSMTRVERIAVLAVLQRKPIGVEADLLIRQADGALTPVTVTWDEPEVVAFKAGAPVKALLDVEMTAEKIRAKYGVGAFIDEDARWNGAELSAIEQALALLSKEELACVKDLPFRRRKAGTHRAKYYRADGSVEINVYGLTYIADDDVFMGTPESVKADSVGVIIHELGHAIADHRGREVALAAIAASAEYKRTTVEADALAAAFNEKAKAAGGNPDKKTQAELKAIQEKLEASKKDADARFTIANGLKLKINAFDAQNKAGGGRPAERAFGLVLPMKDAPTTYGRSKVEENFAESYRLFKADPEALKRISAAAADWFAAGSHLKIASQPLQ